MKTNIHEVSKGKGGLHITSGKGAAFDGRKNVQIGPGGAGGYMSGMNKNNQIILGKHNRGYSSLRGS